LTNQLVNGTLPHDMATNGETKKPSVNGLAIVGFGALILAGIFLAIYAARYVPETLSRLSSAVILSPGNTENPEEETETPPAMEEEEPEEETARPSTPSTGGPQVVTPPVAVSPNPPVYYPSTPNLYGRADLAITNLEVGYFRGSTFVEDDRVPSNRDAAVRFTVKNIGTNIASNWKIRVEVTGEDTARGNGGSLMPNGYQTFTLRIENPEEGRNLDIDIDVDYTDTVNESNERNNDRSIDLEIDD
jgi:hypothetical protein